MSLNYRICDVTQLIQVKVLYRIEKELDLRCQPCGTGRVYDECR
jgi:hypothetical protein